jgi:TorA maturation chaperone TorD
VTPDDIRARAYGCALLAGIFRDGLTDEWLPWAQDIPGVGVHVPEPFEAEQAAAQHYTVFGMNVFPHAGVYLDPEGLLGGASAGAAAEFFQSIGLPVPSGAGMADHVSSLLGALEFLCDAEADALEDDQRAEAARMRGWQLRLLDEHLLTWLPAFVWAVQRQDDQFYGALAGFALEFLGVVREKLGAAILNMPPAFILTEPPALLENPKTSLKDIAAYLLKPALCGVMLTRDEISRIARAHELPHGFGERLIMLHNLFKSAADYDAFPAVLDDLTALAAVARADYAAMTEFPGMQRTASVWAARVEQTGALLAELRDKSIEEGIAP